MKVRSAKQNFSPPTLQVIAEKAHVSRETVSHILGGRLSGRYREETRKRVIQIAEQLNYRPHRGAQAMKSGRSNLIAIVHFGAGIEAAHKTNLELARLVNERGYDYLAMDRNWYGGSMERTLEEIIRARVEGVLVSHIQEVFEDEHIERLQRFGIPVVSVNGVHRRKVPLFANDAEKSVKALTRHLLDVGHRRIVQLIASLEGLDLERVPAVTGKVDGFRTAIEERGRWILTDEEKFFSGGIPWAEGAPGGDVLGVTIQQNRDLYDRVDKPVYRFCDRLFPTGELPDAIVCMNDLYALEAIAAGLEHDVRVPRDLAVTGYDNDRMGEFPAFGLTTVEQDIEAICRAAMEALMTRIAHPEEPVADRFFESRIIIRSSSGKAKSRGFR
ncbi:MAG: LacI family DNA-binding transcriptional regulator [Chthoniobacterales bacterium]|nr:LacI family DNA-binding transcriptional regulator [Chthoniobacterales bacterium]